MAQFEEIICAGCGAPVENLHPGAQTVRCVYCGRTLRVVDEHTEDTGALDVARITDELLSGRTGASFGRGQRFGVGELSKEVWANEAHAVWPSGARASSNYSSSFSADAAVGPPRVYPRCGDIRGAWAPGSRLSHVEWLEVDFVEVGPVTTVRIFETCMPGSTFAVTDRSGPVETLVYRGAATLRDGAQVLEITLPTPRPIKTLRVYVNNDLGSSWSEIDTVALYTEAPLPAQARTPVSAPQAAAQATGTRAGILLAAVLGLCVLSGVVAAVSVSSSGGAGSQSMESLPTPSQHIAGANLMRWDVTSASMAAQGVVWANRVLGYSTQYGDPRNAATQALGAPDVFPTHEDNARAWAPRGTDSGAEYLEVAFAARVSASAIVIVETLGEGALARVDDLSDPAAPVTLWEGRSLPAEGRAWVLTVELPEPREVGALRLVLDTSRVTGWNEIDAVGLFPAPAEAP